MRKYENRLTLIGKSKTQKRDGTYLHEYICSCGKIHFTLKRAVDKGITSSCGCLRRELTIQRSKNRVPKNALKDPYGSAFNSIFCSYRSAARQHNRIFELTKEYIRELVVKNCHYCGTEPKNRKKQMWARKIVLYNGIDRKDNNIGYIQSNCVPCCWDCNNMKSDRDYLEFLNKIKTIYRYLKID